MTPAPPSAALLFPTSDALSQGGEGGSAPLVAAPQGDGAGAPAASGGGGLMTFLPFLVIGAVFWFLIIGPERKNRKIREQMLKELKKGDKVMTTGGLHGRVTEVRDDVVILDTGDVRLKFARSAVQGVLGSEKGGDKSKD